MDKNRSVAVIIAAYNAEKTIERALRSALGENDVTEVIIVDDASADATVENAYKADDGSGRLKILRQTENKGPSAARNRAIAESSGPWIAILDADDFFLPGRIKGLLQFSGQADFIADDLYQVDEEHIEGPRRLLLGLNASHSKNINFTNFVLSNVTKSGRKRAELGFIKPLISRKFLLSHKIGYQEQMRLGEDYELYAKSLGLGARFLLVEAQGYVAVIRPTSLSARHSEIDLLALRDCDERLQQDIQLTKSEKKALRAHYLSVDCRLQWRLLINAVKEKNLKAAFLTFMRPLPVPLYLIKQLGIQFIERLAIKFGIKQDAKIRY